ncbi:MAG TPA: ankyrin repeat domain-containing protein [Sphingomicrobium sp.]|nr:ankyrin repeat domain-containing protein [Sphingomicrobium sp.]
MNRVKVAAPLLAMLLVAAPAAAQISMSSGDFVAAVRDRDGDKAMELLQTRGNQIINLRNDRGETALIVAIQRRDDTWTGFLLNQGADPNLAARNGETPLIAAARVGFMGALADLIRLRAKIDTANRMGETALIVAVQNRHPDIVKVLLALGADPDKADSAAGYSARDYARRDSRTRELLKLIEAADAERKAAAKPKVG